MNVSKSGYFAWKDRPASRRQREDMVMLAHVRSAYVLSHETYGSPQMTRELQDSGFAIGRRRIARLMRDNGLHARHKRRFKRTRIPFLSAMSMIGATDNEHHSYLEVVDALRQYGASPKGDAIELWRRIVFSVLISNTDDHLRNHGFVYDGPRGWGLSPVYGVNPVPEDIKERILTTAITEEDATASLELAFLVAQELA